MDYGPSKRWRELSLVYPGDLLGRLTEFGLFTPKEPIWAISSIATILECVEEILALARSPRLNQYVDRLDIFCHRLILESRLESDQIAGSAVQQKIQNIRQHCETHWQEEINFELLARDHDLSPTHFRRIWLQVIGEPPARFVMQLRLRHACRALIETNKKISEIAADCGFADPFHFARRFQSFSGMSARDYRKTFRVL